MISLQKTDVNAVEALKLEHNILDAVINNIGVGFVVSNKDGRILSMNKAAADIHGFASEKEGLNHLSRYTEEFRLEFPEGGIVPLEDWPLALALKGDYRHNYKVILNRFTTGRRRIVSYNMVPIYDSKQALTFIVLTMTDTTEIEERTKLLAQERDLQRENEQRLQSIFDHAAIGIFETDHKDRFVRVNNLLCKILGYAPEELLGKTVMEITYPGDLSKTDFLNASLNDGEMTMFSYEKRYLKKDGEPLWVNVSVSLIQDDRKVHLKSIGTVEDISERKLAEKRMLQSEEKFRLLFENITEAVALHEVTYKNGKAEGYSLIEANPSYKYNCEYKGKSLTEIGPDGNMYRAEYFEVAQTGKPFRFEVYYADIKKHFIINVISPRKGQFATVFEDITDQKRTEFEIKQKNEELTRFIYTVSHDLKSPLVTIKSFTEYLKEDLKINDVTAQDKDIQYIQNAADKMGKLLDELLQLSRIGRKEDPKKDVPLDEIIKNALDLLAGSITKRNAQIILSGPTIIVYGHSQRLIQLYQNLIDNAVKFMGNQTSPRIEIGSVFDENRNEPVLFVKDNGSGIDPRHQHKLFGLFEKLDTGTEGTGIGLALVKRIIEVHNGTVWFHSDGKGNGTTFYFTLEKSRIINTL